MGNVGDGEDAGKVGGDRINCANEAIAAFAVLGAKALVNDQGA